MTDIPDLFDKAPRHVPTPAQRALRQRLGSCVECGKYPAVRPSLLCARCETAPPAEEETSAAEPIAEIPIPRLPRGGMDWRRYKETVLAEFKKTDPARWLEFRRANVTNLRLLRDAAKELRTDLNMEMADVEREAI